MFDDQRNDDKKLDWMYKGPNSTVSREEYLLGRSVDKTLEQLNDDEKTKQQGISAPTKNRVEHECIPPSIRDFNKVVQAEQVDLSAKLQEDPLVVIKKREEETRRQFLQNPVQLKKLQKALKAQQAKKDKKNKKQKKKKKKKSKSSDSESGTDRNLDTILMHKFNELKMYLSEQDLQDIMLGKVTDSESEEDRDSRKRKNRKKKDLESDDNSEESDESVDVKRNDYRNKKRGGHFSDHNKKPVDYTRRDRNRNEKDTRRSREESNYKRLHSKDRKRDKSPPPKKHPETSSESEQDSHQSTDSNSDSESTHKKRRNYGLVTSSGAKIALKHTKSHKVSVNSKIVSKPEPSNLPDKHKSKKLSEKEKEKLRREMMDNAVWRDKERARNVKKYRDEDEKETKTQREFDKDFIHKQMAKSTEGSSVESRIKSNLNNIQRSSRAMDKNFSKR